MGDCRELARIPISRAHLRALFARDIGTQSPTYARWRRLLDALAAFTDGRRARRQLRGPPALLAHVPADARLLTDDAA